jgi:hypothetical protein
MIRRLFLATFCAGLVAVTASAADAPKACCAKKAAQATKMKCSLTGKVVEKCCCVQKNGKTYCTLAKKDVESCCCVPVEPTGQKEQASRS